MDKETINNINIKCSLDQGIFVQPYGIPIKIKEPVVYSLYRTGGYEGGDCYSTQPKYYNDKEVPEDRFMALDMIIDLLLPSITPSQYILVNQLIHTNNETEQEYYGNTSEWLIEYIILSELENLLKSFK